MIVPDSSVLTDALVDVGSRGDAARSALQTDPHWAAPPHLLIEVVSAIRGKVLGRKLDPVLAAEAVEALPAFVITWVDAGLQIARVWELRANLSAYDAAYVAAAEAMSCPLVTSDSRLAKANGLRCDVQLIASP